MRKLNSNGTRVGGNRYLIGLLLAVACSNVFAAWDIVPQAEMIATTDDNPRLDTGIDSDAQDTNMSLDVLATIGNYGQRGFITFIPRARGRAYGQESNSDMEDSDLFLRSNGEYAWQVVTLGYRADITNRTIRSSEILDAEPADPDFDDPVLDDTGILINFSERQERSVVSPFIAFRLSERNSFRVEYTSIETEYSAPASTRSDYSNQTVTAGVIRDVDARNEVSAEFLVNRFEVDRNRNLTDTVGVRGRFVRPISESWNFNVNVGALRSDYRFVNDDAQGVTSDASTNLTLTLGLRNRTERTTTNIDLGHEVSPNSTGTLIERTEFRVFTRHRLTERLTGSVGLRVSETISLDDTSSNNDRDYLRLELGIEWRIAERLYFTAHADITEQEFVNDDQGAATSNAIGLGLMYRGLSRR